MINVKIHCMETTIDKFWQWILTEAQSQGHSSLRALERASGHSYGAIGSRINAGKLPTVEMAQAICEALNLSWFEFWRRAGVISEPPPSELNDIYYNLDLQGRREAVEILRALARARSRGG
jgi:hypothetical protein